MRSERIALGNRTLPLAVDFSAPTAMLIARERPERLGLSRVLNPQKYADTARLYQLQQYDPARTPVIFVHGLQETGASWTPMVDTLRNDPWIREHYQFWFFSYPSGYPYPYSAALFRRELDGVKRAFPNHKRIVLIGHSMGGMICRLMITDAGDKIWRDYFSTPPAKTPLASDTRKFVEEALVFNHRPEVEKRNIHLDAASRQQIRFGLDRPHRRGSSQDSPDLHLDLRFNQTVSGRRSGSPTIEPNAKQCRHP